MNLASVLEQFAIQPVTTELLGDTQNINHVISTAAGEKYILRQHQTASYSLAALESEMLWLHHLQQHGLEVQKPVALASGNFILEQASKRFSLLTWIEGTVLEEINETQAEMVGALLAKLHVIAQDFKAPIGFERLHYNIAYLEDTLNILRGIEWLEPDMPLLEQAMRKAQTAFMDGVTTWSLIHADLHAGNMIWHNEKVAIIDFDRCGFGPITFDIVTALGYLESEPREAFLRGYGTVQPLPKEFGQQRHLFTIAEWLTNLAFLAPRVQDREYVETIMLPGLREELPKKIAL